MQERARRRASASTISGKRSVRSLPGPAIEAHTFADFAGDDAEAIVLDLVQSRRA
jgi:hypothetical protein